MNFVYDIINLEFVVVVSFFSVAYYLRSEPLKVFLLFGHILVIFLLNDVLFPPTYMGDQLRYLDASRALRTFQSPAEGLFSTLGASSVFFAFFPFPFINSVQSIAMINFLLYLVAYAFLKRKRIATGSADFFFLLYPSLLLYSSVALREVIVLLLMLVVVYFFLMEKSLIVTFVLSIPLIFIKAQNFLILMLTFSIYYFFKVSGVRKRFFFLSALLLLGYLLKSLIISRFSLPSSGFSILGVLENYRNYMYYEETGSYIEGYVAIQGWIDFFSKTIKGFFYMLFKPFPWECENILQVIQSIENLVIVGLIIYVNTRPVRLPAIRTRIRFLNLLLLVSMSVYGVVVFNFGSAARYRFVFLVIYFVFFLYLLKSDRLILNQVKSAWSSEMDPHPVNA